LIGWSAHRIDNLKSADGRPHDDFERPGGQRSASSGRKQQLRQQPTNVRSLVLLLSCAVSFLLYLHRYVWGFVKKDIQDEFGFSPVELGWLDGLFAISYAFGQLPSGIVCDWFGVHLSLASMILAWSLALGGVAWASSAATFSAARVAFGLTQAGCYPALGKASKNWFPIATRTSAQGLIATFSGRGGGAMSFFLFGTVLLGWCGLPWRWAIGIFAMIGLAVGAAFLILFRNSPAEHPWANAAETELITVDDPSAAFASRASLRWSSLAHSSTVLFLCVRTFASNMADVLFVYWVPLYLRTEKEVDAASAGWMAALPLVGGAFGGLTSGFLQSHWIRRGRSRRFTRRIVGMVGKLTAAVLILNCLAPSSAIGVSCLFLAVKFFADWEQPAEWGTISDIAGRGAATVFALVNMAGSIGGFVASPLTGLVLKRLSDSQEITTAGWNAVFLLIAVEYVVASLTWLFIDPERPLDADSTATAIAR
jgi:MFS transporter, ACS family, glucarate transporter